MSDAPAAGLVPALYNTLALAALPVLTVATLLKHIRRGRLREGWGERLGRLPASLVNRCHGREVLWIHAVSVGETLAAKPLIAELRRRRPRAVILLSQITETGREVAQQAGADALFYLPLDLPWIVDAVLDQLRPNLLCCIDTELWPNLLWRCRHRGVKLALANGRISDRAYRRIATARVQWVYRWSLGNIHRLMMQSERDAARVRRLGGGDVRVVGNLKGDEAFPEVTPDALAAWQATLGLAPDEPVLLAGSTGPGEEAVLLAAFARVQARYPAARLVLVPRAIERANEVLGLVEAAGFAPFRRSRLPELAADCRARGGVVVVDTIGELAQLYAVGTVCFVGRSLIKLGGSNVLQAAAQARPVLSGPYVSNVRDSVMLLAEAGVCQTVRDADELATATLAWFARPDDAAAVGAHGREVVLASRGATARTADLLLELLDGPRT